MQLAIFENQAEQDCIISYNGKKLICIRDRENANQLFALNRQSDEFG